MTAEAFSTLSLEDPRRANCSNGDNELVDVIADGLDLIRDATKGRELALDDMEAALRGLRTGDDSWTFQSESGVSFTFKPDPPEGEWR